MTGPDPMSDDLAPHIADAVRATERMNPAVAERVMDVVRAEGPARYARVDATASLGQADAGWWRRRSVQLSPIATLAWAAGLVAVASAGTLRVAAAGPGSATVRSSVAQAVRAETVHVVRFVYRDSAASHVALVGDFNGWAKDATPLVASGEKGAWAVSVTMPPGRHEYAFIVDGNSWSADPYAARVADEFGTESSVVTVGDASPSSSDDTRKSD